MPFTVQYFKDSHGGVSGKLTGNRLLKAVGYGTDSDTVAKAGFEAFFPATFIDPVNGTLTRGDIDFGTLGGLFWQASCLYGPDDAPLYPAVGVAGAPGVPPPAPTEFTPLGANFAFDFNSVTEHITQSKETISKTKRGGGVAPDAMGAIGLTQDGEVKGCDRITGFTEWSFTVSFESVSMNYVGIVGDMIGKTNSTIWYGFAIGTLLFMGGNLQTNDTKKAVGQFKFGYSKNLTNIVIVPGGAGLTVPAKKGWEYLWVSYKEAQDATKLVQQPGAAYVERIYESDDFTKLRIG